MSPFLFLYLLLIGLNVYRFLSGSQACSYYYSAEGSQDIPGCFDPNALPKNLVFFLVLLVLLLIRFVFYPLFRKLLAVGRPSR